MIEVSGLPTLRFSPAFVDVPGTWSREALISSARAFLAEGRSAVSAREIADRAHVSLGAFHGSFSSVQQLFEVAVMSTAKAYAELRDELVEGIEDPAEVFATSCRLTGRLQRRLPEHVRLLLNTGTRLLVQEQALSPRARRNLMAAVEQGRFDVDDIELAFMTSAGALLGLMQMLESDPTLDDARLCDQFAERILRALGMDEAEAKEICRRPLPELPDVI